MTVFVPVDENGEGDPVKVFRLRLRNDSGRPRRLTRHVLRGVGAGRDARGSTVAHPDISRRSYGSGAGEAILDRQLYGTGRIRGVESRARLPFPAIARSSWGATGPPANRPRLGRARLDNRVGAGLDPAAVLQLAVSLDAGQQTEVMFLLGQAAHD